MSGFSIGLSGIDAAQKALDIIGNNIANAATDGYHRQQINLSPSYSSQTGDNLIGGGVDFKGVTRIIDSLLEQQILRQNSVSQQLSQEVQTMQTVESSFGEFSDSGGLNAAIDSFFNSMQDLVSHPAESIYQNQAVSSANAMAAQFRTLSSTVSTLQNQLKLETGNVVEQINNLASTIAQLNDHIERLEIVGTKANNLRDQRDQCITELSKLVGVDTTERDYGVVDVNIGSIPLVVGSSASQIESGLDQNGQIGIAAKGSFNYSTDYSGGSLGGLLSLSNELVSGVQDKLNGLAAAIINEVNQVHFQGVGSAGSFTELAGRTMTSDAVADYSSAGGPVTDGKIYIRVTDTATGETTRSAVDVDASSDTLATIAAKISTITGLSATVDASKLRITAGAGYTFDFLPAVSPQASTSHLTGTTPPAVTISGNYTGAVNQTYTCTVTSGGQVSNGDVEIEVRDGSGGVKTINVGQGYAAGDVIELADGVKATFGTGDLNTGDSFTVDAYANTDTSGLLVAVGMNTLFSGKDASDIAVCSEVANDPSRIAAAVGADGTDNANAMKLSALKDKKLGSLDGLTVSDYYRRLVSDVGEDISIKQTVYNSSESVLKELTTQQDNLSGVNVNDEAAAMLMYQQMFTAMSKYLNAVYTSVNSIMQIL
jgi:flagellar hook-associated protein 1 FlgK